MCLSESQVGNEDIRAPWEKPAALANILPDSRARTRKTSLQFYFCQLRYGHRKWSLPSECDVIFCVMKHDDPQQALQFTGCLEAISSKKSVLFLIHEEKRRKESVCLDFCRRILKYEVIRRLQNDFLNISTWFSLHLHSSISQKHTTGPKRDTWECTPIQLEQLVNVSRSLSLFTSGAHELQCYVLEHVQVFPCFAALTHSFS